MPLFFLVVGVAFLISALRGKQGDLLTLIEGDFTGSPNFVTWAAAIVLVAALGYSRTLRPLSNGLLALLFVGLILGNRGVFAKFQEAFAK